MVGDKIDFDTCKQITNVHHYKTRRIRENIKMEKDSDINKRDLAAIWKAIIQKEDAYVFDPILI